MHQLRRRVDQPAKASLHLRFNKEQNKKSAVTCCVCLIQRTKCSHSLMNMKKKVINDDDDDDDE